MKNNEFSQYDLIEKFIHGEMNDSEIAEFKRELKKNPELAESYGILNGVDEMLSDKDRLNFMDMLEQIRLEQSKNQSSITHRTKMLFTTNKFAFMAAAAVVLISMMVYLLFFSFEQPTHRSLFKNHYAHYGHIIALRDGGDSISSFYSGMQLYKAGSYEDALDSFFTAQSRYKQVSAFYIGLCYLNLDKYKEAAKSLEEAVELKGEHKQDAEWYLALAYLADGKIKQTETILIQIINTQQHYYLKQAKDLQADLKQL